MPRQPIKQIGVTPALYYRVKKKAHPGQSLGGVIKELLDMADQLEGKSPEPFPDSDKQSQVANH